MDVGDCAYLQIYRCLSDNNPDESLLNLKLSVCDVADFLLYTAPVLVQFSDSLELLESNIIAFFPIATAI
jgi:hypothetical protein